MRIGPYEVLGQLGAGGMGIVFSVRHPEFPRPLALKLMRRDLARRGLALARFQREGEVLARIHHPNVVAVHSAGEAPEGWFIVTELVEGESLAERLRRGPLPEAEVRSIGAALADALGAVHAANALHRDIKPDNVVFRPDGAPVLIDFGVVRDALGNTLTQTGKLVGTVSYMAPEQAQGRAKELDPRTDVYGLGATLFAALTGEPPFRGDSAPETLAKILQGEPSWPDNSPAPMRAVLSRCLAKRQADRYGSCAELASALRIAPLAPRTRPPALAIAAGIVAVLGLLGILGVGALPLLDKGSAPPSDGDAPPAPQSADASPSPPPAATSPTPGPTRSPELVWTGGDTTGRTALPGVVLGFPAAKRIAVSSTSAVGAVWLVDAETGRTLSALYPSERRRLTASADRRYLLTSTKTSLTRLTAGQERIAPATVEPGVSIARIALSRDGRHALAYSESTDGVVTLEVWDMDARTRVLSSEIPSDRSRYGPTYGFLESASVYAVSAQNAVAHLYVCSLEEGATPVDTASYPEVLTWTSKVLPDGRRLVATINGELQVIDLASRGKRVVRTVGPSARVVVVAKDGKQVLVVDGSHLQRVDLEQGEITGRWRAENRIVGGDFYGDGVVAKVANRGLMLWTDAGERPRWTAGLGHGSDIVSLAWLPSGKLVSRDAGRRHLLWTPSGQLDRSLPHSSTELTPRGGWLVENPSGDPIRIKRWRSGAFEMVEEIRNATVTTRTATSFSMGRPWWELVVSSSGWLAGIRDKNEVVARRSGPGAFSAVGRVSGSAIELAVGPGDSPGLAWTQSPGPKLYSMVYRSTASDTLEARFELPPGGRPRGLRVLPGKRKRVGVMVNSRLVLWEFGREALEVPNVETYDVDARGARLAVAEKTGGVRVFSLPDLTAVSAFDLPEPRFDRATALAFSDDGSLLAVGLERGPVTCYRLPR